MRASMGLRNECHAAIIAQTRTIVKPCSLANISLPPDYSALASVDRMRKLNVAARYSG